jgi:hypothetical protein
MKTHLISIAILIAIVVLCAAIILNKWVLLGLVGAGILAFAYSMIYIGVSRNITKNDKGNKK